MNDTPGWASPGSAPSDRHQPEPSGPQDTAGPADRPADPPRADGPAPSVPPQAEEPAMGQTPPAGPPASKWSKQQPPPAQWSAPGGPGRTTPPPPAPPAGPRAHGPGPHGPAGPGPSGQGPGWGGLPPGGGGRGQGGPGWGGGWQNRPPAAKPGVIPLRPLGVGEILDGAVSTMRAYWRTVLGISLTVAVVTQIAVVLLQGFVLDGTPGTDTFNDRTATLDEMTRALGDVLVSTGVIVLVTLLGTIVATALLTTVTSRAVLGRPVTLAEAWHDARPRLLRLFGLTLLLPLIVVAIVAAGTLPGILVGLAAGSDAGAALAALGGIGGGAVALWLAIRFSLASPVLMLEKQGIVKSLRRSAKLVKGSWWRVLGIQLLAAVIANIVASIILVPFSAIASAAGGDGVATSLLDTGAGATGWTFLVISGIGSVIGSMLALPITAGVTVLLYIDQRIRREALDLELGRAAGVQGYGTTPGS